MTNAELIEIIKMEGVATRALMRSEIDRIEEMDRIRNGRINKLEGCTEEVKRDTRVCRWAHRNPKVAIIGAIIFIVVLAIGAHSINLKRTIEKVTKIELRDGQEG